MESDVARRRPAARSAPLDVDGLVRSGRLAAGLIAVLGVVTSLGQVAVAALSLTTGAVLSAACLLVAWVVAGLPWSRFPAWASLAPVVGALVLLGIPVPMPVAGYLVLLPLYLVVFLYVGLTQPQGTALWLAGPGAVSAFLQLVVVDRLVVAVPAGIVLVTAILTGETLSRHLAANQEAWETTKASLTGLATLLDSATLSEARQRLRDSVAVLLDSADVRVTLTGVADDAPPPAGAPADRLLTLPLRVAHRDGTRELGMVEVGVPPGRHGRREQQEMAAARILVHEAAKIMLRLQETQTLSDQAGRDPLTGLANRRTLEAQAADTVAGDVLMMLDLDHFKRVNDTLGHAEGDRELIRMAEALRNFARPGDCVARIGGEEFAVLLRTASADDADAWIERVRTYLRPHALTTFSAGLAVQRDRDTSADALTRADAALYEAKRAGRNRTRRAPDQVSQAHGAASG